MYVYTSMNENNDAMITSVQVEFCYYVDSTL